MESGYAPDVRTERTADGFRNMVPCFLCEREFQFGPGRYAGRHIDAWAVNVCETCEKGNHDGLVIESHPRLVHHLAENGVVWRRNARGWVDLPR